MSGHSKWSTIKRAKGAADAKRGQTFTKLANVIALAAKETNNGDINTNPRLRLAVENARTVNMPKENIQRAIDRGLGKLPGQSFEEFLYEGFGPGKVAFLVSGITDNKNRTLNEIKNMFDKSGGAMGSSGSVSYMFDKKGEVRVKGKGESVDDEELELIDTGAEDIENFDEDGVTKYLVYTGPTELNMVSSNIKNLGYEVEGEEIIFKPNISTEINDKEIAEKILNFAEKLEDYDDTQKVFANFDIPEELLA